MAVMVYMLAGTYVLAYSPSHPRASPGLPARAAMSRSQRGPHSSRLLPHMCRTLRPHRSSQGSLGAARTFTKLKRHVDGDQAPFDMFHMMKFTPELPRTNTQLGYRVIPATMSWKSTITSTETSSLSGIRPLNETVMVCSQATSIAWPTLAR